MTQKNLNGKRILRKPLTELSPQELLQRIHAAETAIFWRLQGMRINSIELVEGQAILKFADSPVEVTRAAGRAWGLMKLQNGEETVSLSPALVAQLSPLPRHLQTRLSRASN